MVVSNALHLVLHLLPLHSWFMILISLLKLLTLATYILSCMCRVCISSLILSSASCSRENCPISSILFRSCHKQREMILKYSEHIQRREEVKSYHLIGTCGNLWTFLRGVLGIRSRLITMRRCVRSDAQLSCTEPHFKSALRVIKVVLNTQCYQYLWLAMWFHVKKSEETLKKSKSLILQCKFGSRAQKWPKNAKKTDHSIAIYSIFCIGMVYFGCLQVNPHIQAVPNMCGKGGWRVFQAELRAAKVDPIFKQKTNQNEPLQKTDTATIFKISLPKRISVGS